MEATLEQHIRDAMTREAERAHTPEDYPPRGRLSLQLTRSSSV
jgi:hypothetical protein